MSDTTTPAGNSGGDTATSISAALADLPARIRIHALAKLLGRSSREVLTAVTDLGGDGRSVQSSIDRETALRVAETFGATTGEAAAEPAAEAPAPAAEPRRRAVPPTPVFASASPLFLPPEPPAAPPAAPPAPRKPEPVPDDEDTDADTPDDAHDDDDSDDDSRPRRRRGRRGRGRGKGGQDDVGEDAPDEEPVKPAEKPAETKRRRVRADKADKTEEAESEPTDDEQPGDDESDAASRRRRRRRRRKGGTDDEGGPTEDDPPNTVVHVREARDEKEKDKPESDGRDEVRSVRGSTRLEAKRQRRRDGREAGRRRAPILSEAEFLARREAVDRAMVVRERGDRVQIGVLEDGVLVEHFVTSSGTGSLVGNVYLGRVQNVLPSMEAAFVDIGRGRNAVLYAGEVDWDAAGLEGKARKIEQALSTGDSVLVQVTKDPVGHKGARLTTQISLPGRFLVYVPGGGATGISRKLPENERRRLKDVLKRVVPEDAGVIIRTASEGISEDELARDVRRLQAQWQVIQDKTKGANGAKKVSAPALVYEEPDLLVKVVRDLFTEDFSALVIEGAGAWETVDAYVRHVAPELADRVRKHVGNTDVFAEYRIEEQLLKALDRKVWLPSGGYLVIDRTEAMTVIDVNTGKFTGSGGNLEETVTRNNLESAEEIVRQLRLRDIGGIIVIDFIDMVLESNRDLVLRRLTECLGRDRTRHQVAEVTSLGLVQMTRKRVGTGLLEAFGTTCEHCKGRGVLVSTEPVGKQSNGHAPQQHGGGGGRRGRGRGDDAPPKETKEAKEAAAKDVAAKEAAKAVRDIAAATRANAADPDAADSPETPEVPSTPTRTRSRSRSSSRAAAPPTTRTAAPADQPADSPAASSATGSSATGSSADASSATGSSADASSATGSATGSSATDLSADASSAAGSSPGSSGIAGSSSTGSAGVSGSAETGSRVAADSSATSPADSPAGSPATAPTGSFAASSAGSSADTSNGSADVADLSGSAVTDSRAVTGSPATDSSAGSFAADSSSTGTAYTNRRDVSSATSTSPDADSTDTSPASSSAVSSTSSTDTPGQTATDTTAAETAAVGQTETAAGQTAAEATAGQTAGGSVVTGPVVTGPDAEPDQPRARARRRSSRRGVGQPSVTAAQAGASAAAATPPTVPAGEPSASTVIDPTTEPAGTDGSSHDGEHNGVPEQANGHTHETAPSDSGASGVPAVTPPARRPSRRGASRPAGPPVSANHDG